ncbi:putative transposase [Sulfurisphaera tokodaii str. 7]|uniref:Transposase n=1 Tax=Sulfurisphaera tokodaii (strain DSM 16993 / JCM 10545 / NBRC 100140 / 7) TaxID=273063 RepID=Q96Z32_SULTO|nr:putative transposase [Sulfurisphaera tokodaii str. 7]
MDYETVLKNLDKLANINLIKIVKQIIQDHPVQLRRHTQPQNNIRKRNTTAENTKDTNQLNNSNKRLIHKRNPHYNNTIHTTKSCRNTQGEKAEYKTKIQLYLEILPTILNEYNVTTISFDSWYVNSKTLTLSGNSRQTHVLSRVADTCQLPSSPKGNT